MADNLVKAIADLEEDAALVLTGNMLKSGENALDILNDARLAMEIVGQRFARSEYFLPDLIYSGEILRQISEMAKPHLSGAGKVERIGKVVLGTVAGDIHDIGLNIVEFMLDVHGFEVYNIGIDAPPRKFVEKIQETGAGIVGLSGFLTVAFESMKETIGAIEAAGLRDKVRVMIGGGQIDDDVKKYTGADAFGKDAMAAVALSKGWLGGK